jgi:glutamate-1-semialdehyde 2,1-aminomutase
MADGTSTSATPRSRELFARGARVIPGGVNSPVRAFRAVGGDPVLLARGVGSRVWDVDGNEYVDLICSWGPLILGHAHERVVAALGEAAALGTSFGASTEREVAFAELIVRLVPSVEKVRLVSSGTEATMSALRLARGFVGRDRVVKVEGGYHGHADAFLVRAGSGAATLGVPDSAGVPAGVAADTLTVAYNDLEGTRALFAEMGDSIAAMIVEPVAGNMGVVPPEPGYLEGLRELTRAAGSLLIFDEVITGFRLGLGGAQAHYGVTPDLTCLGKIIGGGLPVGAYGGRAEIMDRIAPDGPVYQAGTLSGNPLAVAAGLATLTILERENPYPALAARASKLAAELRQAAVRRGIPLQVNQIGSMLTAFCTETPVRDFTSAKRSDTARFGRIHRALLGQGVLCAPSQFEAAFLSTAHDQADLDRITSGFERALADL